MVASAQTPKPLVACDQTTSLTFPIQFDGDYPGAAAGDPSSDAAGGVDGVINGEFGFHTASEPNPWWQVDLGVITALDHVAVYNRTVAAERARRLSVQLSNDGDKWHTAYVHNATVFYGQHDGAPLRIPLQGAAARFVRLTVGEKTWLHLDEVQVFGHDTSNQNLALHRPAAQSSVSQWSRRASTSPAEPGGGDAASLRRAVRDLIETFGARYPNGPAYLQRLDAIETSGDRAAFKALQREALLANPLIDFDTILLVRRPDEAPGLGLPANHQGNACLSRNGFDDELMTLSPLIPDGTLTSLYKPGGRFLGDVDLHYNAQRALFSSLNDSKRWRVYEINLADRKVHPVVQIEEPDVDNYDAVYLPDQSILFSSTATYVGVPCVFGSSHVANLYRSRPGTGRIERLTVDQEHNWNPVVMPDGHVLYQRWEYTDMAHPNSRLLFTMNPDGTEQREFYGANSYFPNSMFYPRPVPGSPGMVALIASGHHGTHRSGRLLMVQSASGRREAKGVVREFPGYDKPVTPIVRDRLVDGVWPQFLHPFPLDEKYVLAAARPAGNQPWGIYLVDAFDNMVKIRDLPGSALLEPIPLRRTPRPPIVVDRIDTTKRTGLVYMADVYQGEGLDGVPRGTIKSLRLVTYYYGSRGMGGLLGSIGMDGPWDIRQVLGTVPVEPDGSALFTVPSDTPIAIQPLDDRGQAVQQMRSWLTARPGEYVSCSGCHDTQNTATPNITTLALQRTASEIKPWYGPPRGFSFAREVQPVLDKHCVGCHGELGAGPDLRGDRMITDWNSQIAGHVAPGVGGKFSVSYANLHRHVRRPGIESDMHILPPGDFLADTTELVQILQKGHHGVKLDAESWDRLITWIDLNAPYHGTWGEIVGVERAGRIVKRRLELEARYGGPQLAYEWIPPAADLGRPTPIDPLALAKPFDKPKVCGVPALIDPAPRPTMSLDLGEGVSMQFVWIPAGRFVMGSAEGHEDEQPAEEVVIDRAFWIAQCEVTNEQFARFDPQHDSRLESRHGYQFGRLGYPLNQPRQPVVRISWEQAVAFVRWLSDRTGRHVALPTEAQWEYACRAGSRNAFWFGPIDADYTVCANLGDLRLREYAACTAHNGYTSVRLIEHPSIYDDWVPHDQRYDDGTFLAALVGSYRANPWNLYDMHGNVWEWTRSVKRPYPYHDNDGRNELDAPGRRVVRGGSWYDRPRRDTASYRLSYLPWQRVFNVGFRLIVEDAP